MRIRGVFLSKNLCMTKRNSAAFTHMHHVLQHRHPYIIKLDSRQSKAHLRIKKSLISNNWQSNHESKHYRNNFGYSLHDFLPSAVSKNNFFQKKSFRNTIRVSNCLDPDQVQTTKVFSRRHWQGNSKCAYTCHSHASFYILYMYFRVHEYIRANVYYIKALT